ncbi:MAG: PAS domain S-box protein [Nostocales cyanobacterium 94392]|nr:PAS domain S-box protein [Nostocales cyanobacterium 94392]
MHKADEKELSIAELQQNSSLPLIIANNQGLIISINSHFETVFGWKPEDLIGQMLTIILPPYIRDSHNLGFSRFTATGVATVLNHPLKLKALTKDNREIDSEHYIIAEKQAGEWIFAATLRPLE